MNEMKIFENAEFGQVRTMCDELGNAWFAGKDVAEVLGYADRQKAIKMHVDGEDKLIRQIVVSGQKHYLTFINESGLYSLILSSKQEKAREFKHWVTSEVLPQIRLTGGYRLIDEIMMRDKELEAAAPKVLFADAVAACETAISIADLAKLLTQNGVVFGQHRLFQWMRDHGYLFQASTRPMQRWVEEGLFDLKVLCASGRERCLTKVTGKGQIYFINGFLSGALPY